MERQAPSATGWTPLTPSETAAARAAVDRILASPAFGSGVRRRQRLKRLVEQFLNEEADPITEYGLGLDVFGRPATLRIFQQSIEAGISPLNGRLMPGVTADCEHDCARAQTQFDPIFDGIRNDGRMAALEKRIGLE